MTIEEDFVAFYSAADRLQRVYSAADHHKHAAVVATLPFHHRDPFDRLLVAQAISEGIPIVSTDRVLDQYSVTRIW